MTAEHKMIIKYLHFWIKLFGSVLILLILCNLQYSAMIWYISELSIKYPTYQHTYQGFSDWFFYLLPVQITTSCFLSFPDVFLSQLLRKFRDHLDHFMPWISAFHTEVLEDFVHSSKKCLPGSQTCHDTTCLLLEFPFSKHILKSPYSSSETVSIKVLILY